MKARLGSLTGAALCQGQSDPAEGGLFSRYWDDYF